MRVKKFRASALEDAVRMVRLEMGPEAVILHARSARSGGVDGLLGRNLVEVVAGVDEEGPGGKPDAEPGGKSAGKSGEQSGGYSHGGLNVLVEGSPPGGDLPDEGCSSGERHLPGNGSSPGSGVQPFPFEDLLISVGRGHEGVRHEIGAKSAGSDMESADMESAETRLKPSGGHVKHMASDRKPAETGTKTAEPDECRGLLVGDPPRPERGRRFILTLVGPAGTGKTTAALGLAAHFRNELGLRVALMELDPAGRRGSSLVVREAGLRGIPARKVFHPGQIPALLERWEGVDAVIVDTPGCSPLNPHELGRLGAFLEKLPTDLSLLVLPGTIAFEAGAEAWSSFVKPAGVQGIVLTRLDETLRWADLLFDLTGALGCPVYYLSSGRRIGEDLQPADTGIILGRLGERICGLETRLKGPAGPQAFQDGISAFESSMFNDGRGYGDAQGAGVAEESISPTGSARR
ncbi:MAG: hypothetical protein HYY09_05335 [Firmicutes bacterium]|nr:hypothetical protein [Bacillota bacterium]